MKAAEPGMRTMVVRAGAAGAAMVPAVHTRRHLGMLRYRLDDRGNALPIEVDAPARNSVPAAFYDEDDE